MHWQPTWEGRRCGPPSSAGTAAFTTAAPGALARTRAGRELWTDSWACSGERPPPSLRRVTRRRWTVAGKPSGAGDRGHAQSAEPTRLGRVHREAVLEQGLSLRVSAGNDATLAALAEHRYGAGRPYSHFVYMTLSTGIGGGLILDGKPYTGAGGYGGEVGHVTIDRNGPVCGCGNVGCLEAAASGTAVTRLTRERLAAGQPAPSWVTRSTARTPRGCFKLQAGRPSRQGGGAGGRREPGSRDSQPAERLRPSGLRHRRGHVGKPRPPSASRGPRDRPARHGPPP